MKTLIRNFAPVVAALALSVLLTPASQAQCGGLSAPLAHPAAPKPSSTPATPSKAHLLLAGLVTNDDDRQESVVGFWHVKFIASTPDGPAEIDAGYSQWHSDGTEIMNSGGRAPITGDFCLGVWERVGYRTYKLNHFAAGWDPTATSATAPYGAILGPAQIQEEITVTPDGDHFSGTFTIDQYDESGNLKGHVGGKITGVRITVHTPEDSVF
jgi:hypothetical protein